MLRGRESAGVLHPKFVPFCLIHGIFMGFKSQRFADRVESGALMQCS